MFHSCVHSYSFSPPSGSKCCSCGFGAKCHPGACREWWHCQRSTFTCGRDDSENGDHHWYGPILSKPRCWLAESYKQAYVMWGKLSVSLRQAFAGPPQISSRAATSNEVVADGEGGDEGGEPSLPPEDNLAEPLEIQDDF